MPNSIKRSHLHAEGPHTITLKIQEAYQYYRIIRGQEKEDTNVETRMETQFWHHPAETITFLSEETKGTSTVQIYTDSSTSEKGVGTDIAIFITGDLINSLKFKLNNRRTNNQTENLTILKALQHTVNIHAEDKTATDDKNSSGYSPGVL